jgi:hypothetical protein
MSISKISQLMPYKKFRSLPIGIGVQTVQISKVADEGLLVELPVFGEEKRGIEGMNVEKALVMEVVSVQRRKSVYKIWSRLYRPFMLGNSSV